jgi:hypothetical protein
MSERGLKLRETADEHISELIGLFSARGEVALSLPCPGREKLGDGTVGALALHTADSYLRIAGFLEATSRTPSAHGEASQGRHPIQRLLSARGDAPPGHSGNGHDEGTTDGDYAAETVDLDDLLDWLSAGRDALSLLAELTDERLDTVPPAGSFRFCDGQRTLEQVVASLLNHQRHQIDAIKAALA